MPPRKHNWVEVKADYVNGWDTQRGWHWPTTQEVAKRHDIPRYTVKDRAEKEDWATQQKDMQFRYYRMRTEKVMEVLSQKAADFDLICAELAEEGLEQVRRHFAIFRRLLAELGPEATDIYPAIDLQRLAQALERFQKISKLAVGEPTEHTKTTLEEGRELVRTLDDYAHVFAQVAEQAKKPPKALN